MDNRTSNRVNMIRTTISYCGNHAAATAAIAAFAPLVTTVKGKLVLIDQLDQVGGGTTTGVTLDTNAIRGSMSLFAFKCGSALSAYASSVDNSTLSAKVNYTGNALNKFKKDEIDDICQTIHDEADTNIAAAGSFGYDAGDVTALQTGIDLYRASIQNPRQQKITIDSAKSQMKDHVDNIVNKSFKGQMDKMVNTLKATNATFVKEYFKAREVIDLGATSGKVRGTAKDIDGNPLKDVIFSIHKTGDPVTAFKTSSDVAGKFGISNIPHGDYDFFWDLPAFQQKTEENVHLAAGKELSRTVTLLKV